MDRRTVRPAVRWSLAVVALFVAASCGGDGGDDGDDEAGAPSTTAAVATTAPDTTAPDTTAPDTVPETTSPATTAAQMEAPATTEPPATTAPATGAAALTDLTIDPADALAALECDGEGTPMLFVHGTGSSPEESFGPGFAAAIAAAAGDTAVCTIALPDRAVGDIQVSGEYVAVALAELASSSGGPVPVLGHSQGVLVARWAIAHWSPVASASMLVAVAGPNAGAPVVDGLCAAGCAASLQQMRPASAFLAALDAAWSDVEVPVTVIRSLTDEFVPADSAAAVAGATLVTVQDVCPASTTTHAGLLADAVTVAAAVSALENGGVADPSSLGSELCAPPTDIDAAAVAAAGDAAFGAVLTAPVVTEEPPLAPYV
jgi:triacylglycerol lipase